MSFAKGFVLAALFAAAVGVSAQSMETDLKALMDSTGLKYDTTKSGRVAITRTTGDGRTQVVYIAAKASKVGKLAVREVWSNGGYYPADVESATLIGLLTAGSDEPIGSWNLESDDDGSYLAYFATSVPMTLSGSDLVSVIDSVAGVADALEATLSDADDN